MQVFKKRKIVRLETSTLVISNEEMGDIMEVVKSLEESGLSIKSVIQTIDNEKKERWRRISQERWISLNAIRYCRCSLLANMLAGKIVKATRQVWRVTRAGEGMTGQDF